MALVLDHGDLRILFIHVPKTGGQWTRRVLRGYGARQAAHEHAPLSAVPEHHRRGRLVVMGTRDPLAWYASLYLHVMQVASAPYVARLRAWGGGSVAWPDVLYGWTHPEEREALPEPGVCWDYPRASWSPAPAPGEGYWTWTRRYFGLDRAHVALRQEHLEDDLRALLGCGPLPPPTNTRSQRVGQAPVAGARANYLDLYDAERLGWVEAADGVAGITGRPPE